MSGLILVVEDHEDNRRILRDLLTSAGFEFIEAETGLDGVKMAKLHQPDLILMDLQLPGIDGIEALRQLRIDPATREIPVMAVTASVMTHDLHKITAAGFDGNQSKPISVRPFLDAVETLLARHRGGTA